MSANARTVDGQPLPTRLKLVFSKAADQKNIAALYDPAIKHKIDPHSYVVERDARQFAQTIAQGGAAMLQDDQGNVHTLTIAWRAAANEKGGHNYTEIGTSMTRIAGFHSAHVVIAAIALNEWWSHKPKRGLVAEVLLENGASRKAYCRMLGWDRITSKATVAAIDKICNENVTANDNPDKPYMWIRCNRRAIANQAHILLDVLDRGVLKDRDGAVITLDLTALDAAGLTRARLQAMAEGEVNRRTLRRL